MLALKNPDPGTPTQDNMDHNGAGTRHPRPAPLFHALPFSASQLVFVWCCLEGHEKKVIEKQH